MPRNTPAATPRPEVLAFLADIKEAPEDDAPRLIFADWLEEQGDPRGEFMRVQCQLARMSQDDPRRNDLRWRESELRDQNILSWLGRLPPGIQPTFRRGLLQLSVSYPADLLRKPVRNWAETEAALWLESLQFSYLHGGTFEELTAVLELLPVVCLSVSSYSLDAATSVTFAALPALAQLRELELTHSFHPSGVCALGCSPHLARLRKLVLSLSRIDVEGAQALATSPYLHELRVLDLHNSRVGVEGTRALAGSPLMAQLTELNLAGNELGDTGASIFLEAQLPRLNKLDLSQNKVSPEIAAALRQRFGERVRV
jgi:uncharacterized protein (TIGR02996 family)